MVQRSARATYGRLVRSRTMRPMDDKPAWALTCFFVKHDLSLGPRDLPLRFLEFVCHDGRSTGRGLPSSSGTPRIKSTIAIAGSVWITARTKSRHEILVSSHPW